MKIEFTKFAWDDMEYILKEPVEGSLEHEKGLWIFEVPYYNLHSYSLNKEEALALLNEDFDCQYEEFAYEPDDNLTLDAIKFRDRMKDGIAEILKIEKQYYECEEE